MCWLILLGMHRFRRVRTFVLLLYFTSIFNKRTLVKVTDYRAEERIFELRINYVT